MTVWKRLLVILAGFAVMLSSMLISLPAQADTAPPVTDGVAVATTSPLGPVATTDKTSSTTEQVTSAGRKAQPDAYEAQLTALSPGPCMVVFGRKGSMEVRNPVITDQDGNDTYQFEIVNFTTPGLDRVFTLYDYLNPDANGNNGTLVFRSNVKVDIAPCDVTIPSPRIESASATCKTGNPANGWYIDVKFDLNAVDARRSHLVLKPAAGGNLYLNLAKTTFPVWLSYDPGTVWKLEVAQDATRPDEALLEVQNGILDRVCVAPTASATTSPTATATTTVTATATATTSPTATASATATATSTATTTVTATATATASATKTPTATSTVTATVSPTKAPTTSSAPTVLPTGTKSPLSPSATPGDKSVYTTPGYHKLNGRDWYTGCEEYSQTVRCRTLIWATQVTQVNGRFVAKNGWAFNNLTYQPFMKRSQWASNPLGHTGSWTATDGRQWRTECDTAATGRNGCRSSAEATVIEFTDGGYRHVKKFIFNNIVLFK